MHMIAQAACSPNELSYSCLFHLGFFFRLLDVCTSDDGQKYCSFIHTQLEVAFLHLLKKRQATEKAKDILNKVCNVVKELKILDKPHCKALHIQHQLFATYCGIKYNDLTWSYIEC